MLLKEFFSRHNDCTVLIVQCRLSSTRLPEKALLPLGKKCVLEWALSSMKKVKADRYFLATDKASEEKLAPVAKKCGFEVFAGSLDDVLDRFCNVIKLTKGSLIIRATADNTFLLYEAASSLVEEYRRLGQSSPVDYLTYTGLPHGSGVEVFNGKSLLKAAEETASPYDHEHVGPALYNHQEKYKCKFIPSPKRWNFPHLRTTIDTQSDYRRALSIVNAVCANGDTDGPYTTEQILSAFKNPLVKYPVLFVPSTKKNQGTGHLYRCLELAAETGNDIFISENPELEQTSFLVEEALEKGLKPYQIIRTLDNAEYYALAVLDSFKTDLQTASLLSSKCAVCALDEGNSETSWADYLLDVIPSLQINRNVNLSDISFMKMSGSKRVLTSPVDVIKNAVVVLGGEDPAGLTMISAICLAKNGISVTAVLNQKNQEEKSRLIPEELKPYITIVPPVKNLRNELWKYDLVVTHYGFTAFEACSAGCNVILEGTSELHEKLSRKYGFVCLKKNEITPEKFASLLSENDKLKNKFIGSEQKSLASFITSVSKGISLDCPVCHKKSRENPVVSRTSERTFRRCSDCSMIYISWSMEKEETSYSRSYFYEDYRKQYGKTYLEDFPAIKSQCVRRMSIIDMIHHSSKGVITPCVLDVGCAMGPFLSAANDAMWQVFGIDISKDAVEYVQNQLNFPATCSAFPDFNCEKEFGIKQFDAVTMWYVIEHFKDLDKVLKAVSSLLKKGGIFAFSTPSASGVSAKYNRQEFFEKSPSDHYSLWEPEKVSAILKRYDFEIVKIVSTGIHPERFPSAKKHNWTDRNFQFNVLKSVSRIFKLGDTFEVYARKTK
ncbi:MAG: methyltransferase domain-containing protein [Treponema sp.]|nr:methyltransferase domain-containing protein [Treponema sp.]